MARPTTAARRYAEAAFELATRDDAFDAWSRDLALAAQLVGDERVSRVVHNPALPFADRQALLGRLLHDRVRPQAENLVLLLARRSRLELLPAISRDYDRLHRESRGIATAVVTSAAPLTKDEIKAVRDRVTVMTGSRVELESVVDPSLIGGLTVLIGDRLLDASVRGRLERLRAQLIAGAR